MAALKYSSNKYHQEFDSKAFLKTVYQNLQPHESLKGFHPFFLKAEHKFWSRFPQDSMKSDDEVRCLEYGGGPTLCHLISATPKVDRIVFSEFTEANRQAVSSWIAGDDEAHNWRPFTEYVVGELEGDKTTAAILKRETELKRKIKSIVPCDINASPIVQLEDFDIGKSFDVVSTSLCLESCVGSAEQYKNVVAKLCELIKPNGYLRMNGVLEESWYLFGEEKLYSFPLTKELVESALKEAHLKDVEMEIIKQDETDVVSDRKFLFHVFGRKSENNS